MGQGVLTSDQPLFRRCFTAITIEPTRKAIQLGGVQ